MTSERLIALLTTTKTCPVKKFLSLKVTKKNKAAACSLKSRARSTDSRRRQERALILRDIKKICLLVNIYVYVFAKKHLSIIQRHHY